MRTEKEEGCWGRDKELLSMLNNLVILTAKHGRVRTEKRCTFYVKAKLMLSTNIYSLYIIKSTQTHFTNIYNMLVCMEY